MECIGSDKVGSDKVIKMSVGTDMQDIFFPMFVYLPSILHLPIHLHCDTLEGYSTERKNNMYISKWSLTMIE